MAKAQGERTGRGRPSLLAYRQALLRRVWRLYAGRFGHEQDRGEALLLLLQGAEGQEVLEEASPQGVGRGRSDRHPQGVPGRQ